MKKLLLAMCFVFCSATFLFAALDDITGNMPDSSRLFFTATPADPKLCRMPSNTFSYNVSEGILQVTAGYHIVFHNYLPISATAKTTANGTTKELLRTNIGCYKVVSGNTTAYYWLSYFRRVTSSNEALAITTIQHPDIRWSKVTRDYNYNIYNNGGYWIAE